ncbi:MAG: hypothetical protein WCP79_11430 [Bacillota bacterium]
MDERTDEWTNGRTDDISEKIVEYVKRTGSVSSLDIQMQFEIGKSRAAELLKLLVADGLLLRIGKGKT